MRGGDDPGDIAQCRHPGAETRTGNRCLKLPGREVLRYVSDEVAVDVDPFVQIDYESQSLCVR